MALHPVSSSAPPRWLHRASRECVDARLLAVAAAGFAAFVNLYAPQSLLPTLVRVFNARHDTVGLTVSAATLAIALASPFTGLVVTHFRRAHILRVCFFGLFLTTLGCAGCATLSAMIAWRFVQGLFIPPVLALTMSFIGEAWAAHEVSHVMAIYVTFNVIGGFCGRFVSGVGAAHLGWRAAFVLVAVLNAAAAWQVLRSMPDAGPRKASGGGFNLRVLVRLLRDRRFQAAGMAGFTVLFALVGLFTYVTFYLSDAPFHLRPDAIGALFAVYLVGVVVTPLAGRLIHPLGHARVIAASTVAAMVGALVTLIPSVPCVLVGLAICCSAAFVNQAAATGYVTAAAGEARSTALGLYLCGYYLGGSAGAAVPGLMWIHGGWPGTVALLLAVHLVTILLTRRLR